MHNVPTQAPPQMPDRISGPFCAHILVSWHIKHVGHGETSGWWACNDCGMPFRPFPPAQSVNSNER